MNLEVAVKEMVLLFDDCILYEHGELFRLGHCRDKICENYPNGFLQIVRWFCVIL